MSREIQEQQREWIQRRSSVASDFRQEGETLYSLVQPRIALWLLKHILEENWIESNWKLLQEKKKNVPDDT